MPRSKFLKSTAICGIGAAVSFIPAGLSMAHAAVTKATKTTVKKSGTFLGSSAMTAYGPVQVSVTLTKGKITKVTSPVYPMGTYRDQQINSQAIPMLEQEVLKVQSSKIYGISGASYTSVGFYQSLIYALAKGGLK